MPNHQSITGRPRKRATDWAIANLPHICWLCGYPIDMNADRQRHPLAWATDEYIPRKPRNPRHTPGSALDHANLRPSHRWCNGSKHNHDMTDPYVAEKVRARCRTHIAHLLATINQPTLTRTW